MEPIIKVDNVSMCFNLSTEKHESLKEYLLAMVQGRLQYDEFYALRDVSLDIMPGDFYGLVGLNGSGKSTLLKTIAGVYKPTRGKVTVNGTPVELTRREFDLLACLLEHKGKVLSRSAILNTVWGYDYVGETNTVDVYIRFLRSKLDEVFGIHLIETVRGVGYVIRGD